MSNPASNPRRSRTFGRALAGFVPVMVLLTALLGTILTPQSARAAAPDVTDAQVRRTIDRAVARLKSGQMADGHWQVVSNRYGGMTALAVLALLQAGLPVDDAVVAKGLAALENLPDVETYVASLRLMALLKADEITGKQR